MTEKVVLSAQKERAKKMLDFEHLEKQLQENNEMLKDFSSRIAEIEDKLERNKVLTNTLYEKKLKKLKRLVKTLKKNPGDTDIKPKRQTKVKTAWLKLITTSTFHGVSRIMHTENGLIKVLWLLLIIVSITCGLVNIIQTTNDFLQYDVITNVERTSSKSIAFPAITICTKQINRVTQHFYSIDKQYFSFNLSLRHFMRSVQFKGKSFNLGYENAEIEFFRIPKSYGNCVRFNGNDVMSRPNQQPELVSSKSDSFGMRVVNSINGHYASRNDYDVSYTYIRMDVYVTENHLNSYMNLDPLNVETNKDHGISIARSEIETKLEEPFNDCIATSDNYHQSNCIERCINEKIGSKYNCSIPSFYRIDGLEECGGELQAYESSFSDWKNQYESEYYEDHINYVRNLTDEFFSDCEKECPKECESTLYSTQLITSTGRGYTAFSFSFSDFSTLNITQIPKMNEWSLISSIGGSLGLFAGVSFLSFAEWLEFFIDVICILISN